MVGLLAQPHRLHIGHRAEAPLHTESQQNNRKSGEGGGRKIQGENQ